jgi:hypothetical protein
MHGHLDLKKSHFDPRNQVPDECTHLPHNIVLQKYFKLPDPALNIQCHNDDIATDTIESNFPAFDGDQKYAQILIGTTSLLTDIYPLKSISMFPSILSDHIIDCGAPKYLLCHSAKVEMSKQVKDILCTYGMGCWQHIVPVSWSLFKTMSMI